MNEVNCSESGAAKRSVFDRFVMWWKIPRGAYCYRIKKVHKDTGRLECNYCPHHYLNTEKPEQLNGGCRYLGIEDDKHGTLLWDSVKECGVKNT